MPRARSDGSDAIDLGADGPAALVREVRTVTISGEARGSVATVKTTVRRVACECTLDTLNAQHHLAHGGASPDTVRLRYRAGLRFRGLWLASAQRARVVFDPTTVRGRGSVQDGLAAGSDARDRVTAAIVALGMIRSAAVIAVCGEDESARGRLGALCDGLDRLIEHWELAGTRGVGQ